ncbi:MAG: hypothetical protein GXY08_01010 [Ruminococcus sp.]|nr:hypothetical protein [Ruminococcus sp.]
MKKNNIENMFDNVNSETVEKIAAEYPTGDKKHRDYIYKEVERRVDGKYSAGEEVRGVETYRPRPYLRFVSAAAALVIVAGAVGGSGYLIKNSKKNSTSERAVPATEVSDNVEVTDALITTEAATAVTAPEFLTKDELIEKINNRSYENYDRVNIEYSLSRNNGVSIEHGIAMRDGITGNESLTKTWTHSADYFPQSLIDEYGLENLLKEEATCNEMFFYKDLYICIYSNGTDDPHQYEVTDRSNWKLDDPTVFRNLYSEDIAVDLDVYDIDDTTSGTVYLGRQCTEARIYADPEELQERLEKKYDIGHPKAITEPGDSSEDLITETILTVDNETGFILKAVTSIGDYKEEFAIENISFNEDAELPPDAAYIKSRIESCIPNCQETAEYDLSVLNKDAAGSEESADEEQAAETANDNIKTTYEVNSKGQTYGPGSYSLEPEYIDKLPDYVAIGIDGGKYTGYICTKEFLNIFVDGERAFDMQKELGNVSDTAVATEINIYDKDGNFKMTRIFYNEPENIK